MKKIDRNARSVKSIGCELLCEVARKGPDGTTYGHSFKYILKELKKQKPDSNTKIRSLYNFIGFIRAGNKDFKGYKLPDSRLDSKSRIPSDSAGAKSSSQSKTAKAPTRKAATQKTKASKSAKRKVTPKKSVSSSASKSAVSKKVSTPKSAKRAVAAKRAKTSKTVSRKALPQATKTSKTRSRGLAAKRLKTSNVARSKVSQKSVKTSNVAKRNVSRKSVKSSKVLKRTVTPRLVGTGKSSNWKANTKIAFIRANWHFEIVDGCRKAFVANMRTYGIKEHQIEVFDVPGSYEIPLLAKQLSKKGHYDVIVGCGLVIDGGIYRHEFVAEAVINGIMQVQLDSEVPILSAVLTPHNFHESNDQERFFKSHFKKKGLEVSNAAKLVLNNKLRLQGKQ